MMERIESPGLELDCDRAKSARMMTPSQRIECGGDLFDAVVERMEAGIRMENPKLSEDEVLKVIRKRLDLARKLESTW